MGAEKFDEKKVTILRLTSNEEVIAISTKTESDYILDTPFAVHVQADQHGKPQVLFAPFLFLKDEDEEFHLPKEVVAFSYKANAGVAEKYKELYMKINSKLILPTGAGKIS